jgi:hypothetical protein
MGFMRGKWMRPDVPFRPDRVPFFYGWVVVGASVLGMVSSMPGQTAGVGPFTEDLLANLELSRVQLSIAYLGGTALSGLILPRIGRFFDRFGARLTGTLVEVAFGLSLFYMASCALIYQSLKPGDAPAPYLALPLVMLGFFLIRFLGQGVVAMTSRAMLGKWFNRKRGLASAIGGALTGVCFSAAPLGLYSVVHSLGWREAWMAMGLVLMLGVSTLCWLLYRDNPEECGLVMDGEAPPPAPTGPTDPEFNIHKEFTAPEAIRTYPFWVFTAAFSLIGVFMTAVGFHAVDDLREHPHRARGGLADGADAPQAAAHGHGGWDGAGGVGHGVPDDPLGARAVRGGGRVLFGVFRHAHGGGLSALLRARPPGGDQRLGHALDGHLQRGGTADLESVRVFRGQL